MEEPVGGGETEPFRVVPDWVVSIGQGDCVEVILHNDSSSTVSVLRALPCAASTPAHTGKHSPRTLALCDPPTRGAS